MSLKKSYHIELCWTRMNVWSSLHRGHGLFGRCILLVSLCSLFGGLGLLGSLLGDLSLLFSGLHCYLFSDLGLLCGLFWTLGLLCRSSLICKLGSIFETLVLLGCGLLCNLFWTPGPLSSGLLSYLEICSLLCLLERPWLSP